MNIKELASAIAYAEDGKSKAKICDIREILRIIADLMVEDPEVMVALVRYANKRARASGSR
jgi:predicted RNA polymerase sigma factor